MKRGWESHEADIQEMFGLRSTIASGNKWYDQGDGVTPGRGTAFPLYVDGKYTETLGYRVTTAELAKYENAAASLGKRLVLALRMWPKRNAAPLDYVVLSAHDFKELLDILEARVAASTTDKWVM